MFTSGDKPVSSPRVGHDPFLWGALALGPFAWAALALIGVSRGGGLPALTVLLMTILVSPLLEEYVFRGVLQAELFRRAAFARRIAGLSVANIATSVAFAAMHLVSQPALWAAAVFLPSLVFGACRDRYGRWWPSAVVHSFYNAGFVLLFVGGGLD